jgi:homeobox protein cut-like
MAALSSATVLEKIRENEELFAGSRKNLGKQTRLFKKHEGEEKLKHFGALLKLYQKEIDSLTKRAKFTETAYVQLDQEAKAQLAKGTEATKALEKQAAAPSNAGKASKLEPLQRKVAMLEVKNKSLENELKDVESELMGLKNQDITIRELEEKLASFQVHAEGDIATQVQQRQQELELKFVKDQDELQDKMIELNAQVETARGEELKAKEELDRVQSELFALRSRVDEEMESHQRDLNELSEEAERANAQVQVLEEKWERSKMSQARGGDGSASDFSSDSLAIQIRLQAELVDKDTAIERFKQQLNALREDRDRLADNRNGRETDEKAAAAAPNAELKQLREALKACPSVEEFHATKSKLRTLEMVLFNAVDDDSDKPRSPSSGADESPKKDDSETLERLLVKKIHRMESRATQYKIKFEETSESLDNERRSRESLEAKTVEQDELIRRLENDLASHDEQGVVASSSNSSVGGGAVVNVRNFTPGGKSNDVNSLLRKIAMESPSIDASFAKGGTRSSAQTPASTPVSQQDSTSMEHILRGQRDRYRKRVVDLEAKISETSQVLTDSKLSADQLRKDNIKLYEKIRYLQSYPRAGKPNRSSNMPFTKSMDEAERGVSGTVGKYHQMYEQSVNPFTQFNKREKQRRFEKISAMDKAILVGGRFFMQNRISRSFLFFYMLFLHFFLFVTMYNWTHAHHTFHIVRRTPIVGQPHSHEHIQHK